MATNDRGKLRMERLRQLELEQIQWDNDALVMPENLNRALFLSFESVKTEFSDLDGLSWARDDVHRPAPPSSQTVSDEPTPKLASAEIDPSHTRIPQRATQDTIRVSPSSRGPLQLFAPQRGASHPDPHTSPCACSSQTMAFHALRQPACRQN